MNSQTTRTPDGISQIYWIYFTYPYETEPIGIIHLEGDWTSPLFVPLKAG